MQSGVVPYPEYAGSVINSKEFPFDVCVEKPLILVNELTIATPDMSEQFKNVLGGEPTTVNVKKHHPQLMQRKPVLLTSNLPIWRFVTNDMRPLKNRMFRYPGLKKSKALEKSKKKAPNFGYRRCSKE